MNFKLLLTAKILFAISIVSSLGIAGYLGGSNFSHNGIGKSFASQVQATSIQQQGSQLQTLLNEAVENPKLPGVVLYISTPKATWLKASGVSSLEAKTAMKPTDGFSIASMSKTFVAVVILKLVEQKKLNLDKAIASYLPSDISPHITNSNKITVRQLLNHSSGVAEYLETDAFKKATAARSRSQPWTAAEAIKYIYDVEAESPPGKKFAYTDTNYILLELIVQKTTGGTLEKAMRSSIFQPLGLKHTFTELREPPIGHIAIGYNDRNKDGKLDSNAQINDGNGLGDGGLISNAEDLAKFAYSLFGKKSLLSAKMTNEMLKFTDNEGYGYGLGVERLPTPYGQSFGHTGTAYGFVTLMAYIPSKDTTLILLLNGQDVDIKTIAQKSLEIIFNQ